MDERENRPHIVMWRQVEPHIFGEKNIFFFIIFRLLVAIFVVAVDDDDAQIGLFSWFSHTLRVCVDSVNEDKREMKLSDINEDIRIRCGKMDSRIVGTYLFSW